MKLKINGRNVFLRLIFHLCFMIELKKFLEMLEKDEEARAKLADILATEIALRSRKLIVRAVLKEVATKDDLKELESRLIHPIDKRIDDLNQRIDDLNLRIDDLNRRIDDLRKFMGIGFTILAVLLSALIGVSLM